MNDREKQALSDLQAEREGQYSAYYRMKLEELRAEIARKRSVDALKDGDEVVAQLAAVNRSQHLHRADSARKSLNAAAAKVRAAEDLFNQVVSQKPLGGHTV